MDAALSALSQTDGQAAVGRIDANGAIWVQMAGALSSTVDSVDIQPPGTQVKKSYNTTSQQTGADVWTPGGGKKIRVTSLEVSVYGTTAGRLILFFSANADTTYTEGTDEPLHKMSYAPSTTVKPGAIHEYVRPYQSATADYELHITTDAAMSVDIVAVGYEV